MNARRLVAVVDDDESVRESLPDLLGELGFEAETFASGLEFLRSDVRGRADVFVFDIAMPRMGGLELLRMARQEGSRTPIIFITARTDDATRNLALAEGGVACLIKPFGPSALLEALELAIPRSK